MEMNKPNVHRSFDVIGDIAIVNFKDKVSNAEAVKFARSIVSKNKRIRSVFRKVGKITGKERRPKLKLLYGEDKALTVHTENGCRFEVDVKKVFFTPRLSSERQRVVREVKGTEDVLDMFCGVGPFSIPIAKVARSVYSIDINRDAIKLLEKNIKLNHIRNLTPMCMDAKDAPKLIKRRFDRIIMNLPAAAVDYLPYALKMCKDRCIINLYSFVHIKDDEEAVDKAVEGILRRIKGFKVKSIKAFKAGEAAPYLLRVGFDIEVKKR
ncbi:MAG: class I SAM-dependent methyltransferase family protein [Candidatus Parvarchaeota archaeon]|nr:class I SAM-dependent methyltransferase family protein [Candidatus Parvarchaeota archaeon]